MTCVVAAGRKAPLLEVVRPPLDGLVARVVEDARLEPGRIPFIRARCIARRTATGAATISPCGPG